MPIGRSAVVRSKVDVLCYLEHQDAPVGVGVDLVLQQPILVTILCRKVRNMNFAVIPLPHKTGLRKSLKAAFDLDGGVGEGSYKRLLHENKWGD